jgi:hypothetical protein
MPEGNEPQEKNKIVNGVLDWRKQLANASNYIVAIIAALSNILLSMFRVEDGKIVIATFTEYTALDWIMWVAMIVAPVAFGLVFCVSMQAEGVRFGESQPAVVAKKAEYNAIIGSKYRKGKPPRSKVEYLKTGKVRNFALKTLLGILLATITGGSLIAGFSVEKFVGVLISLAMWVAFGVWGYAKASEYAQSEYIDWLSDEIKEITDRKAAEAEAEKQAELSKNTEPKSDENKVDENKEVKSND